MFSKDSWIHFRPLVKCLDCSSQSWWLGNPPNVQRSGQIELKTCVHFTKTPSRLVGICFLFLWNSFDDVWIRFVTKTFQTSLLVILISTRDTHNLSYAYVLMSQGTKEIQGRLYMVAHNLFKKCENHSLLETQIVMKNAWFTPASQTASPTNPLGLVWGHGDDVLDGSTCETVPWLLVAM